MLRHFQSSEAELDCTSPWHGTLHEHYVLCPVVYDERVHRADGACGGSFMWHRVWWHRMFSQACQIIIKLVACCMAPTGHKMESW
jgi:hypothetical protein